MVNEMSIKVINRKIASIGKSTLNIRDIANDTATMILSHARIHGDFDPMARLIKAVPSESMKKALLAFFRDFSVVAFSYQEGELHANKNKSKEWPNPPSSEIIPSSYSTPVDEQVKQQKEEKRQAQKEQKAADQAALVQQAAKAKAAEKEAQDLRSELASLKKLVKTLEQENASLRQSLALATAVGQSLQEAA